MFKALYYCYYLFYTRVIPDDEPHATTLYTLSVTETIYFVVIAELFYINFYCKIIPLWGLGLILGTVILKNYIYFFKINDKEQIIKAKKRPLSILIALVFFLTGIYLLIWLPYYLKSFLSNCQSQL